MEILVLDIPESVLLLMRELLNNKTETGQTIVV
jgi:hypothetical protein